MRYLFLSSIALIILTQFSNAQDAWIVPDDKKSNLSTFEFNDSSIALGQQLFELNCVSCHGNPGKDNWQRLVPPPGDPAASKFQSNSDGELLYKISEGRGLMPSFKTTLSQNEIWDLISYLRGFNPEYVQQIAEEIIRSAFGGEVYVNLQILENESSIQAYVFGTKDGVTMPISNAPINMYIERRFGRLMIDEQKLTDAVGKAIFNTPQDIPGDSVGKIKFIARLMDEDAYGRVETDTSLAMGIPTNRPSLVANRAMFNKMIKAPVWLLLTYGSGVALAWGVIFYILLQIRKIYFIGHQNTDINNSAL